MLGTGLGAIFVDGAVAAVPFTLVAVTSFLVMPRMWLHALPPDIQQLAGPKTATERTVTAIVGVLVVVAFFGGPIALTWRRMAGDQSWTLADVAVHLHAVWLVVNLWDLVGIDWPFAAWVDPGHPPIPGTEGARGYTDMAFHRRAFVKACVRAPLVLVPAAWLLWRAH